LLSFRGIKSMYGNPSIENVVHFPTMCYLQFVIYGLTVSVDSQSSTGEFGIHNT
jgi:hypothetical protein